MYKSFFKGHYDCMATPHEIERNTWRKSYVGTTHLYGHLPTVTQTIQIRQIYTRRNLLM